MKITNTIHKPSLLAIMCTVVSACGGAGAGAAAPSGDTLISAIQGVGDSSPFAGQSVSISAIVSGDFQDNDSDTDNNLGGFYAQQEFPDGDAATSEGLFVFDGSNPATNVSVGDRVRVSGTINEYFGETQLNATSVSVAGSGMIEATDVNLPIAGDATNSDGDSIANLERFEGMLVRFPQTLTVSNLRFLEQFGEVGLVEGGRAFQFTNANAPDAAAYAAHRASLGARTLLLDDGQRSRNPGVIKHLGAGSAADYSIRGGDSVTSLTGNLRYSRGSGGGGDESWRLMPTETVRFDDDNPRPGAPAVGGGIRVASFNALNFFTSLDNGQPTCGPDGNQNCRGADSAEEFLRQLAKTTSALMMMDADVVGLVELENNASQSLSIITDDLNAKIGGGSYAYLDTGSIGDDAIKTGFIYDADSIRTAGSFATLTAAIDPRFDSARNRPALAQSFEVIASGAVFSVVVNHLKSKASDCDSSGDPNTGDGQANCNLTRTNAAAAIADWITTDPTGSGDADYLVIGDMNANLMEDPMTAFRNAGLTSLLDGNGNPYSFVFDAQAGALDHAVATQSLAPQVVETIEWHINADEPQLLDYNLEHGRSAAWFDADSPYRASDHDPVIIGLDLTK